MGEKPIQCSQMCDGGILHDIPFLEAYGIWSPPTIVDVHPLHDRLRPPSVIKTPNLCISFYLACISLSVSLLQRHP
jgi:hypothetical protein